MTIEIPKKSLFDKVLFLIFKEERQFLINENIKKKFPYSTSKALKEPLSHYLKRVLFKKDK